MCRYSSCLQSDTSKSFVRMMKHSECKAIIDVEATDDDDVRIVPDGLSLKSGPPISPHRVGVQHLSGRSDP